MKVRQLSALLWAIMMAVMFLAVCLGGAELSSFQILLVIAASTFASVLSTQK